MSTDPHATPRLPDRPNLRHLKDQARDLVKAGTATSVTDAQFKVARLYGYNNIPTQLPELPVRLPIENTERTHKHEARKIWAKTLGFTEISNYSFYNEETFKKAGLEDVRHIRVKNPLSAEQTHMRTTLIPSLLEKIRLNQRQKDQI